MDLDAIDAVALRLVWIRSVEEILVVSPSLSRNNASFL